MNEKKCFQNVVQSLLVTVINLLLSLALKGFKISWHLSMELLARVEWHFFHSHLPTAWFFASPCNV